MPSTIPNRKAGLCCPEKSKADCPIPGDGKAKNAKAKNTPIAPHRRWKHLITYCYNGMTGLTFKQRYHVHQSTFRDEYCGKDSAVEQTRERRYRQKCGK